MTEQTRHALPVAPATEPRTEATAKRWATLNIPNPYRPDTVAWVAFESGQLAALDAIEAEAGEGAAPRAEGLDVETIRDRLTDNGWYIANVVDAKWVESSKWGPGLSRPSDDPEEEA